MVVLNILHHGQRKIKTASYRPKLRQRAVLALDLLPELEREVRERQAHGQTAPGRTFREIFPQADTGKSREKAAAMAGANRKPSEATKVQPRTEDGLWLSTGDVSDDATPDAERDWERESPPSACAIGDTVGERKNSLLLTDLESVKYRVLWRNV